MVGDALAQHLSHPGAFDALRVLRLGAYGLLIDGPVGSKWYDLLERAVLPKEPLSTRAVLAKTALDQTVRLLLFCVFVVASASPNTPNLRTLF